VSGEALDLYPSILDISVLWHSVVDEVVEVLST
jgi:hypothetical protein